MSFLKKAMLEAQAEKLSIIDRLRGTLGGYEPARPFTKIHASEVTKSDFCARRIALLDVTGKKVKDEFIPTALKVTFDVGNMMSDLYREEWGSGWTLGNWECLRCGDQRTFCTRPKDGCTKQKKCEWKYREMNFVSKHSGISGSLDALTDLKAPKYFVTELKIMAPDEFEKLVAPKAEHRLRTSLYMRLVSESDSPYKQSINTQYGKVLYISRAYGKKHAKYEEILPFKEFDVERDDASTEFVVKNGLQVKLFREKGLMPQGTCGSAMDKRAKSCEVCAACWSGKYPAQQE